MRKNYLFLIFLIWNLFQTCHLTATTIGHDTAIIKKCSDFKITGQGLSDQWIKCEWIDLKMQESVASDYFTRVKVLYSQTGIYFLFDCSDKLLTSTMKEDNMNLWKEDVVEVFLWTDENFPVYFEYELSPFNFELPILVPNNNGKFLGWLPWNYNGEKKTRHATSVTGGNLISGGTITGWKAEFFIPYKLLEPLSNVPPSSGTKWRANMYRIDHDNGAEMPFAWQKTSHTFHEYKKFGTFIFE